MSNQDSGYWQRWIKFYQQLKHKVLPPKPVPPPVVPPPTPRPASNRYKILHDFELPPVYNMNGMSRTADPNWTGNAITPETCRINGFDGSVKISPAAQKMVEKLNAASNELNYVTGRNGGWVNSGNWPNKVEQLTFGGNYVDVLSIVGNKAYIRVWNGEDGSGQDDDCVIHHWTNIGWNRVTKQNQIFEGGWHGAAYIVLNYPQGVWIPLDRLAKSG